ESQDCEGARAGDPAAGARARGSGSSSNSTGACHLYLRHTTAALTVMTWETGVPEDIMDILQTLTPKLTYRHASPAHVAAHFLSALVGPSVHVPVHDGKLALGEFQRIVLMEFEGPRTRSVEVRLLAAVEEPG